MKANFLWIKVALAFLLVAGVAVAAEDQKPTGQRAEVYKTPDLLGKQVKNRNNDHLGYLEDVVIDLKNGRVAYAVLTSRGTVGFGGKMFALPLSAFKMAQDLSSLTIDTQKNEFENAEGFDANRWPTKPDPRWSNLGKRTDAPDRRDDRRDDKKPASEDRKDNKVANQDDRKDDRNRARDDRGVDGDGNLRRLTSLNGLSVKNEAGHDLGKVQGFAIDVTNGKVVYAAMSYGGVAGVGAKYFAIPWDALELKSLNLRVQDRAFVLNAEKGDFENQAGFDRSTWPVKAEMRFKGVKKDSGAPKPQDK